MFFTEFIKKDKFIALGLKNGEQVRERPGMVLGSVGLFFFWHPPNLQIPVVLQDIF